MKIRLWHWYKDRNKRADDAVDDADLVHERIMAQWPEVIRHTEWARNTRRANHLTELFFDFRGGKS